MNTQEKMIGNVTISEYNRRLELLKARSTKEDKILKPLNSGEIRRIQAKIQKGVIDREIDRRYNDRKALREYLEKVLANKYNINSKAEVDRIINSVNEGLKDKYANMPKNLHYSLVINDGNIDRVYDTCILCRGYHLDWDCKLFIKNAGLSDEQIQGWMKGEYPDIDVDDIDYGYCEYCGRPCYPAGSHKECGY